MNGLTASDELYGIHQRMNPESTENKKQRKQAEDFELSQQVQKLSGRPGEMGDAVPSSFRTPTYRSLRVLRPFVRAGF